MINGGDSQYDNSPYYPLPFASGIVAGTPDSGAEHAQLLPKFTLADGSQLLPVSYIKDIRTDSKGSTARVSYRQDALAKLGKKGPSPDQRIRLEAEATHGADPYRAPEGPMASHVSCATDNFTFDRPLTIKWTLRYR
jgi:hypothetical protein